MKKILLACDGKNIPAGAFEFIKQLQLEDPIFLAGAFLHSVQFEALLPGVFAVSAAPVMEFLEEEQMQIKQTTQQFRELCERNALEYTVHEESQEWNVKDLGKESRFADLMIMSEELFYPDQSVRETNALLQEAVRYAECPVMLFPESYKSFNRLVVTYDGKKESMFAIKEFCNLFPGYTSMETKIIYAKEESNDDIPDMNLLAEYAGRHFSNLDLEKQYYNPKTHFNVAQ